MEPWVAKERIEHANDVEFLIQSSLMPLLALRARLCDEGDEFPGNLVQEVVDVLGLESVANAWHAIGL